MRGKRIVIRGMADEIFKRYNELKQTGVIGKEAFEIIQYEIKGKYEKEVSTGTIGYYARKEFHDARKTSKLYYEKSKVKSERKRLLKWMERNPSYAEYLDSLFKFERGETLGRVSSNNDYINTLRAINEVEFSSDTRGDKLAKRIGIEITEIRKHLMILSRNGLIKNDTSRTREMTKKGKAFLKELKLAEK